MPILLANPCYHAKNCESKDKGMIEMNFVQEQQTVSKLGGRPGMLNSVNDPFWSSKVLPCCYDSVKIQGPRFYIFCQSTTSKKWSIKSKHLCYEQKLTSRFGQKHVSLYCIQYARQCGDLIFQCI